MTYRPASKSLLAATALALAAAAGLHTIPSHGGEFSSADVVRPKAGLSFAVGSKHAVGYFVAEQGGCNLTLLVADSGDQVADSPRGDAPARFNTLIGAGRTARIDTADGPSVEFFCSTGASWLTSRIMDRVAYSAPAR